MQHTTYGKLPEGAEYVWGHHNGPDGQMVRTKTAAGIHHPAKEVTWLNDEPAPTIGELWAEFKAQEGSDFPAWLSGRGVGVSITGSS